MKKTKVSQQNKHTLREVNPFLQRFAKFVESYRDHAGSKEANAKCQSIDGKHCCREDEIVKYSAMIP